MSSVRHPFVCASRPGRPRWAAYSALVLPFLLCTGFRPAHAQDVELEIRDSGVRKPRLAIAHFPERGRRIGKVGVDLRTVLRDDLDQSGIFDVQRRQPPGGADALPASKAAGLHVVVRGEYWMEGNEFVWEVRAYDTAYERQLVGKRYRGRPEWSRTMAHAFADDLVLAYTGKRGIARTQIAYLARTRRGAKELFLMDYDGAGKRQITQHGDLVVGPGWAQDARQVYYTSYHGGNPDLYRATLETGDLEQISSYNGLNTAAAVSPDGTELALTLSRDGNTEIYVMTLATKRLRRLTHDRAVDTQPTWSPNGQELAFVSDREGAPRLYVMDREGADVRRVTYGLGYTTSPAWSPQGDRIAFVTQIDGVLQLMTITPQGTRMVQITQDTAACEDPSWSPDGRHVAYGRTERGGDSEIWTIRADGTGARRVSPRGVPCTSPAWSP